MASSTLSRSHKSNSASVTRVSALNRSSKLKSRRLLVKRGKAQFGG
jgi:hypothetical protein